MVSMSDGVNPTFVQFLMAKVAARKAHRSNTRTHVRTSVMALRIVLHIAGFACLTYAAYMASVIAGVAVAGLSCFVLARLFTATDSADGNEQMRQHG